MASGNLPSPNPNSKAANYLRPHRAATLAGSAAGAAGALLLAGCLSVPEPPADLARRHVNARDQFAATALTAGEQAEARQVLDGWLASFNDPALHALVHEAWERNPDLYEAAAVVDEAYARLRTAAGLLYPEVNAVGSAQRFDSGAVQGGVDVGPTNAYSLGLQAAWEVDLWGRLRANRLAALQAAQAASWDYVQARHSIAAAVAEAYFAITAAREQLEIDRQLLQAEEFTAETTLQRVAVGVATSLDEDLSAANVDLAQAAIDQDQRALAEAQRALELLVGDYPAAEVEAAERLPNLPPVPPTGVPAELLERRPDVLAAEERVNAAFYNVKQAQAARLPSLTLSASGGTLLDPEELFWSIAADLFGPVFTGGRLEAQVDAASAQQRQAIGRYASVALQAFREVENALSGERYLAQREAHLDQASDRLRDASEAAQNRYQQGLLTIIDLQQVRRQDFQTRAQLVGVRFERLRQRLDLFLALGGSVTPAPDAVTDATPATNELQEQAEPQEPTNGQ